MVDGTKRAGRCCAGWRLASAAALFGLALVGCSDLSRLEVGERVPLREPPKQAETGVAREHQRILTAYGGAYADARLEALQ